MLLDHRFEGVVRFGDGLLVGELAMHKGTGAALLHHFGTIVAGQLAKPIVAVDNWVVHDPGVGQDEAAVCNTHNESHCHILENDEDDDRRFKSLDPKGLLATGS